MLSDMSELEITSLANPKVKNAVKLRQRSHRDESREMLVEGYRECKRALDSGYKPRELFFCEALWLKHVNEPDIVQRCADAGAAIYPCSAAVFEKMAYRERPDGLLMVGPYLALTLAGLKLPDRALVIVTLVRECFLHSYESVFLCALTLALLYVPSWAQVRFRIELPDRAVWPLRNS